MFNFLHILTRHFIYIKINNQKPINLEKFYIFELTNVACWGMGGILPTFPGL